jgi:hypothetical protein
MFFRTSLYLFVLFRVVFRTPLSDTTNRERCPQKTSFMQTLQIERGDLKNNPELDTTNKEWCPQNQL